MNVLYSQVTGFLTVTGTEVWGGLATAAVLTIGAFVWQRMSRNRTRARHAQLRDDLSRFASETATVRVLEYGPDIMIDDDSCRPSGERFVIAMPPDLVAELKSRPAFRDNALVANHDIFGSNSLNRLGEILDIDALPRKIERFIAATVSEFASETKGVRFNGKLFGVRSFHRTRVGKEERPYLQLSTYETDYFTFKIMDKFHRHLTMTEPSRSLIRLQHDDDIKRNLYPFLVSIGLNFILICADRRIILTRRSENLDRFGLVGTPFYPSFNEAVSQTDVIIPADRAAAPSIPGCFARGLHEELGLKANEVFSPHYRMLTYGSLGLGFGVFGFAETALTSMEIVSRLAGRDRGFESAEIFAVDLTRKALDAYIADPATSPQVKMLLMALKVDRL